MNTNVFYARILRYVSTRIQKYCGFYGKFYSGVYILFRNFLSFFEFFRHHYKKTPKKITEK